MLYEIVCDKFKQNRIEFHNGLNVILGTNEGDNSIGKSSFLLIVDFVLDLQIKVKPQESEFTNNA